MAHQSKKVGTFIYQVIQSCYTAESTQPCKDQVSQWMQTAEWVLPEDSGHNCGLGALGGTKEHCWNALHTTGHIRCTLQVTWFAHMLVQEL